MTVCENVLQFGMPWSREKHREYRRHGVGKARKAAADKAYVKANKAQILARAEARPPSADAPSHRTCTGCGETKPLTEVYFMYAPRAKFKLMSRCRACRNKESLEAQTLKMYEMTTAEVKEFRDRAFCEICGSDSRLVIDHCHVEGQVRGVLCSKCNTGIGQFDEDKGKLLGAIRYVEKHRGR